MLEVTVSEHFELDRARLWDALADLESHREWMTDVRKLRFLTEQRSGVGTRYEITVGPLRRPRSHRGDHLGPSPRAGDHPPDQASHGEGRFLMAVDGAGTRLEWRARFEIPWWAGGRLTERSGAPATRRLLTRNLGSLRRWLAHRP